MLDTPMLNTLRTPDECFSDLIDYPFAANYVDDLNGYKGMRVHYVDEGSRNAEVTVLCLHGNPSWSYLYRKMIPVFTAAGLRVIAPDLLGFGKSDKPINESVYTFEFHRNMLLAFIERMNLRNVMLVCQDWGGVLGLTIPMMFADRFTRLLVMNTALATGAPLSEGFQQWQAYSASQHDLDIAALFKLTTPILSPREAAAYAAPFPDASYKAGVRRFPMLVPTSKDEPSAKISQEAKEWWRTQWTGRSFMAIGEKDRVIPPAMMMHLASMIKGCPEPMVISNAGHFVQEWGGPVAEAALAALLD
jgi:haloalkane dehalogenase